MQFVRLRAMVVFVVGVAVAVAGAWGAFTVASWSTNCTPGGCDVPLDVLNITTLPPLALLPLAGLSLVVMWIAAMSAASSYAVLWPKSQEA